MNLIELPSRKSRQSLDGYVRENLERLEQELLAGVPYESLAQLAAGGGSLPFGKGVAAPAKLLGLATWHRHKGPCEHVKRLEAETNASRADYHRGVSGKIRSLAQAVEGALTDRGRSCCSGGGYQDRPRHTSRRALIGTWLCARRWA